MKISEKTRVDAILALDIAASSEMESGFVYQILHDLDLPEYGAAYDLAMNAVAHVQYRAWFPVYLEYAEAAGILRDGWCPDEA